MLVISGVVTMSASLAGLIALMNPTSMPERREACVVSEGQNTATQGNSRHRV
jgi:hypothetical protein